MNCEICELPIQNSDVKRMGDGFAHSICFDIGVASLSEEIGAVLRSEPDKYVEVRPGVFCKKQPVE